ncbi:TPA: DEAD/DEAH box helicase family protein [Vibrio parahaemolyticus]|nr:protein DpdE [Vibrio parahaemolyticus]HCG8583605.1 DEAD/DEAH box helicase family protein [Vibrio parahaemolyticus]HCG9752869.1 DEAD/DEAH box helicase family protein [Vibrio parahaemolyticus]HCH1656964.1 DEAD/DEAH box helicase family protein [Vibrio parahaemolyticus]HCH1660807.1 DEAD/DEAH box helicase family protein [Vibrio parahaemolyticus]
MSLVGIGALVKSQSSFDGIGKIISINIQEQTAIIGFFNSPLYPYANQIEMPAEDLIAVTRIQEQTLIFCKVGKNQRWKLGFYGGVRPHGKHLVVFNRNEMTELETEDLFIPNSFGTDGFNPKDYLIGKGNTAPFLTRARADFMAAYIAQRSATCSISSLLSCSVELEPHQLAVVKRVLQDEHKKYLLCDEVGLGKTIEAGFLIREHILEKRKQSRIFVFTPDSLTKQWYQELKQRFHLEDVLEGGGEPEDQLIHIGQYKDAMKLRTQFGEPSMVVVDEAHQLCSFAWRQSLVEKYIYDEVAKQCHSAKAVLLLTGTPLLGNERDYLAMLHCVDAKTHQLTESGLKDFSEKLAMQSRLLGYYRPLDPENDDETIESAIEDIDALDLNDAELVRLIERVKPLVDFWTDEEVDSVERYEAVLALREYFGSKYTVEYRMLRNRRSVDPRKRTHIDMLFPGLGKCELTSWSLPGGTISLDEQFDAYRSTAFNRSDTYGALTSENFVDWLDALMTSPLALKEKISAVLKGELMLSAQEREVLSEMLDSVDEEQQCKDGQLSAALFSWLDCKKQGKAVVFCGHKATADRVFDVLLDKLGDIVERHSPEAVPKFLTEETTRVLVCDRNGEDGLNLQGSQRLAVHYSLPLSISRVEQRNGRLNRYSAYQKANDKVETLVLVPECDGFYRQWANLLISGVQVFSQNCASLQYKVDEYISAQWPMVHKDGYRGLAAMQQELSGEAGIVAKAVQLLDRQEVFEQDVLDIVKAKKFSNQVYAADIDFEEHPTLMKQWITNGLLFNSVKEEEGTFRYQFHLGRTRLNVSDFINYCFLGMDLDFGASNPATKPMSYSRTMSVQSGFFPFRYGQPFVDAIDKFTADTPLGISSAFFRIVGAKLDKPELYFCLQWLVAAGDKQQTREQQINSDEKFAPYVHKSWLNDNGQPVDNQAMIALLNEPYSKKKVESPSTKICYNDQNLTVKDVKGQLVDFWSFVEQEFDDTYWANAIELACEKSKEQAQAAHSIDPVPSLDIKATLLSISAVILVSG